MSSHHCHHHHRQPFYNYLQTFENLAFWHSSRRLCSRSSAVPKAAFFPADDLNYRVMDWSVGLATSFPRQLWRRWWRRWWWWWWRRWWWWSCRARVLHEAGCYWVRCQWKDIWEVYGKFIIINGINCSPTLHCNVGRMVSMVHLHCSISALSDIIRIRTNQYGQQLPRIETVAFVAGWLAAPWRAWQTA